MKHTVVLCFLILAVALVFGRPESSTPRWSMEECEERAQQARQESTVCKDYKCVEHSYGLAIDGVDCLPDHN